MPTKPRRYLLDGLRLSLTLLEYQPGRRQYVRTGRTRTTAVRTQTEAAALWRAIEAAVKEWEQRP